MGENKNPWNSLEITKIIVSAITPLTIGGVGAFISYSSNQASIHQAKASQDAQLEFTRQSAVYAKRVQLWDTFGPSLISLRETSLQAYPDATSAITRLDEFHNNFGAKSHYFSRRFKALINEDYDLYRAMADRDPSSITEMSEEYQRHYIQRLRLIRTKIERVDLEIERLLPCELGIEKCPASTVS